jgi:hypothetical protein
MMNAILERALTGAFVPEVVVAAGRSSDLLMRLEDSTIVIGEIEVRRHCFSKTPDAPADTMDDTTLTGKRQ